MNVIFGGFSNAASLITCGGTTCALVGYIDSLGEILWIIEFNSAIK
jgi:hypothetical protein